MNSSATSDCKQFKQRSFSARTCFRFHPDYLEYSAKPKGEPAYGFNVSYSSLPAEFDYKTFYPGAPIGPALFVLGGLSLQTLYLYRHAPVEEIIVFFGGLALLAFAIAALIARWQRNYTVLVAPTGNVLVFEGGQHDEIIRELQSRRLAALRDLLPIDPYADPWDEFKKLSFLHREGVITDEELATSWRQVLDLANHPAAAPVLPAASALH